MSPAETLWRAVRAVLPGDVACAVVPIGQGALLPDEARAVARAVPRRQAEFAAGRLALRRAIAVTGLALEPDRPILPRPDRRPDLPAGLSVSLAHAGDLCIALASRRPGMALGVDLEPADAIRPEGLADSIRPFRFRRGAGDPLLVFCAKEALFKRQFPATGRMLDFADMAVVLGKDGRIRGCLRGIGLMQGLWLCSADYLLAVSVGRLPRP